MRVAGLNSSRCDGARPAEVMKTAILLQWKGPTSRKEREKWGTPIIYDAGEVATRRAFFKLDVGKLRERS